MTRQLFMEPIVGAPFDWGLAAEDLAREWSRSALAARRSGARPSGGPAVVQCDFWPGDVLETAPHPWVAKRPDRKWTGASRPMSIPPRRLARRERQTANARLQVLPPDRPLTRTDCIDGPRPCPYVSCRYHLYLDVSENGWLKLNFPHLEVWNMAETCALDVADRHEVTLEQLGALLNISLEGARQVEMDVLSELRTKLGEDEVATLIGGGRG